MLIELVDTEGSVPGEWARAHAVTRYEIVAFTNTDTNLHEIKMIRQLEDDSTDWVENFEYPIRLQSDDILTWRAK
jgi:hypothetical protein